MEEPLRPVGAADRGVVPLVRLRYRPLRVAPRPRRSSVREHINPCPRIADALGASVAGDKITLGSGTFLEHGLVITVAITINGAAQQGPTASIIDAQGQDRHFLITAPGAVVTIKDVMLTNGTAPAGYVAGGGSVLVSGGTLEVLRSRITASTGGAHGGAISCYIGCEGLTVRDSTLVENSAGRGGAIYTLCGDSRAKQQRLTERVCGTRRGDLQLGLGSSHGARQHGQQQRGCGFGRRNP